MGKPPNDMVGLDFFYFFLESVMFSLHKGLHRCLFFHLQQDSKYWGFSSGAPWFKKNVVLLEQVQRRAMRMLRGTEHLCCEDSLRQLGLLKAKLDEALSNLVCFLLCREFSSSHHSGRVGSSNPHPGAL